jgi:hypothetical protein
VQVFEHDLLKIVLKINACGWRCYTLCKTNFSSKAHYLHSSLKIVTALLFSSDVLAIASVATLPQQVHDTLPIFHRAVFTNQTIINSTAN